MRECVVCRLVYCHRQHTVAGIGPWKVAMLSAVLVLWDVMWWAEIPMNQQDWIIKAR